MPIRPGKKAGALSGGGGSCVHTLQMLSWPAGSKTYSYTTVASGSGVFGDFLVGPFLPPPKIAV